MKIDLALATELGVAPHKLAPPISHRPDLDRPRVTDLLCSAETPLVLVEAGAGYGKTTASRQLAYQAEPPVGWLSLDLEDDDPIAFVRALACSIAGLSPMTELLRALRQRQVGMERRAIRELVGLMRSADRPLCLIIEDVHTIVSPIVLDVFDYFLDSVPSGSHVVLTSRTAPDMRTARRLVGGDITVVGADDLAFTDEESVTFLRDALPRLEESDVEFLANQVRGWPAGLQLAVLALSSGPDPEWMAGFRLASEQHTVDYLTQEFLRGLPDEERTFLLRSSVLAPVSGAMADFALEQTHSTERLRRLVRSGNAFVVSQHGDGLIRYHPLFAEFLQAELAAVLPDDPPRLHRRAAEWHQVHRDYEAAIGHALAAGDAELATNLMFRRLVKLIASGRLATLERWLDAIDRIRLGPYGPLLALARGWLAYFRNERSDFERWLELANTSKYDGVLPDGSTSLEVAVAALRMATGFGGVKQTQVQARLVREAGPGGSPYWSAAAFHESVAAHLAGQEPDLAAVLEPAEFDARGFTLPHVATLAHLGVEALRRGHNAQGHRLISAATQEVIDASLEDYPMVAIVFTAQAYDEATHGATLRSEQTAAHALSLLAQMSEVGARAQIHQRLLLAQAALLRSDPTTARHLVDEAEALLPQEPDAVVFRSWVDTLRRRLTATDRPGALELTAAEQRILEQLETHQSLAAIADHLYVSRNTIKSHTLAIYRKLGVPGRGDAIERARSIGLLSTPSPDGDGRFV